MNWFNLPQSCANARETLRNKSPFWLVVAARRAAGGPDGASGAGRPLAAGQV